MYISIDGFTGLGSRVPVPLLTLGGACPKGLGEVGRFSGKHVPAL